ncbi:MAG: hypothetical protein LBO80_12175 [Treponema sp.]|jgi:hypothetical protein|nr:hypothetical protein [Treponema sp.]
MVLSARGKYVYTPKFNRNRELPENERMTVEIIRPRAEERPDLYSLDVERDMGLTDLGKKQVTAPLTFKNRFRVSRILRSHIGSIKNLSVEEDGKSRTITGGEDLAESTAFGLGVLVNELIAEVLSDTLSGDEKKSLPPPSNSSIPDGPENGGTGTTTKNGKSSVLGP